MPLNQNQREKIAIRTVLDQLGEATYQDIALRAGEMLASPLMEMVRKGDVEKVPQEGGPSLYRLAVKSAT